MFHHTLYGSKQNDPVWGECGESVGRVWGECRKSVGRVWGEGEALVNIEI